MRARLLPLILGIVSLAASFVPLRNANAATATRITIRPAAAISDNDDHIAANNLDMVVTNHGSIASDLLTGNAGLVYPKGSGKTAVYAAGPWVGAKVNGETRVAVGEYGQEFTPGPMRNGTFQPDQLSFHNFVFDAAHPLSATELSEYKAQGGPLDASGQAFLLGDATVWSVFNDADPDLHTNQAGRTLPLGVEIQQTVFAFNRSGALGNTIFVKWKLLNKGGNVLNSAYFSVWSDPDLGGAVDDLIGCDTTLSLGYCYNATNADAQYGSAPPAVGFTLLRGAVVPRSPGVFDTLGMTSFVRYINGTDPTNSDETYNYMTGLNPDGTPMRVLDDPSGAITQFAVSGLSPDQPSGPTNWLDSNPSDRRMAVTTGPFTMAPGESQEIIFAICIGQGTNRLASIADLRSKVRLIQTFQPPEPPPPSTLTAGLTLEPHLINRSARAPWLTAYLEPTEFTAAEIDPSTVLLAGVHAEPKFAQIADHDADGLLDLMLKFPRAALDAVLVPGIVHLDLTGSLVTGESFTGAADIRVLDTPQAALSVSLAPNPLNPSATLRFTTTRSGPVRVRLFDARGRWVRTLLDERELAAGPHELAVDGRGDRSAELASGVYWFRIDAPDGHATGRFALLK